MPIVRHPFLANAHLLKLLGDELIGNDQLAIFELIKNAYDADATKVYVIIDIENGIISVRDNGIGMDIDTIREKWLVVGTPSKRGKNRTRTPIFNRMPLGEKGVGRLAAHKLGADLSITTKSEDSDEIILRINWPSEISDNKLVQDVTAEIEQAPKNITFKAKDSGTIITISSLHKDEWTRGEVRKLNRMATSLISPFNTSDDFEVSFKVPGYEHWLSDALSVGDILDAAIWRFTFKIDRDAKISWNYEFTPPASLKRSKSREDEAKEESFELIPEQEKKKQRNTDNLYLVKEDLKGIGPIEGDIFIYDRRRKTLSLLNHTNSITQYLDEQTGVRIYRDNIRVYNYGEQGNDWLDLDSERINQPGKKMGNKSVIAAISLDLESSNGLVEKTNREGFDENKKYLLFRRIIQSVIEHLDLIRKEDRKKLDSALKEKSAISEKVDGFSNSINNIYSILEKHPEAKKKISPHIERIEKEYGTLKEVMLRSGLTGLNMTLVFHEIEREISYLDHAIKRRESAEDLSLRSEHLLDLIDGFSPLLRKSKYSQIKISSLLRTAERNNQGRFKYHNIVFSCPILSNEEDDIEITAPSNLVLGVIHNVIDNAIYWSRRKSEEPDSNISAAILISNVSDFYGKPAIAIIDDGPGFSISSGDAIKPFFSKRILGSGLGLYFSNLTMQAIGGEIIFTSGKELNISSAHTGAAVVLVFGEQNV